MKKVFPGGSSSSSQGPSLGETSHAAAVTRADKLLSQLRANESDNRYSRRRYNRRAVHKRKDIQRNLVVLDYPGKHPPAVQVLHDYNKVYEGILTFNNSSSEEDIKAEIASLLQLKQSYIFDLSSVTCDDFVFVKSVNRRVRVPDGKAVYDAEGLKSLFKSGNIYVRLTKSFLKHKV